MRRRSPERVRARQAARPHAARNSVQAITTIAGSDGASIHEDTTRPTRTLPIPSSGARMTIWPSDRARSLAVAAGMTRSAFTSTMPTTLMLAITVRASSA